MDQMENSFDGVERNIILCFACNLEFTGLESFFLVPEYLLFNIQSILTQILVTEFQQSFVTDGLNLNSCLESMIIAHFVPVYRERQIMGISKVVSR